MIKNKTEIFKTRANKIHNYFYNYEKVDYKNSQTKVIIICPVHGEFLQIPNCHLNQKQGCKECKRYSRLDGRRLTTEQFINKANIIHNNYYTYIKSNVYGNKNKVIITCKSHGDFLQSPNSHLKGRGCKQCYLENNGYGKSKFVHFAKKNKCLLYLLEVYNDSERFLKIGITSKSVKARFNGDKKLPYQYEIVKIVESGCSSYIWDKEIEIKRFFKNFKYIPNLKFKGYTECFNLLEKDNLIEYLQKL